MQIYLIRHGEIDSNVKKIYAGTSEEPLNANGRRQVESLASRLEGRGIELIYTSPLRRAVETAKILSEKLKVPLVVERDLREILLGPLDGLSHNQVITQYPEIWKIWNENPAELKLEGMEPLETVQQRILAVIRNWVSSYGQPSIIAGVTHLAVLRCVLLYTQGKPLNEYRKIEVPNATAFAFEVTVTRFDGKLNLKLVEEIRV